MKRVEKNRYSGTRHFATSLLLVAAIVVSATLLILVYGTQTLTWQEVFSYVDLSYPNNTGQSNNIPADENTLQEPAMSVNRNEAVVITIIDVGQGDCILIETPAANLLIDSGDVFASDKICDLLEQKGIARLDYVFVTHPHLDHIGGMVALLLKFEIGRLTLTNVASELTPTNNGYFNFLKAIKSKDIDTRLVTSNEKYQLDKGVLTILSSGGYDNLNDSSLVMRYEYEKTSFLFTGDAGFQTEDDLIESQMPKSDVLKAGHHGSKYSTGDSFLKAVSPKYVVVSCGANNQYGYPTESFMQRVEKQGAMLLRTDTYGDVVFVSDGINIAVEHSKMKAA